jgi:hypothetical protein
MNGRTDHEIQNKAQPKLGNIAFCHCGDVVGD